MTVDLLDFLLYKVNVLMIILLEYGEQLLRGCARPKKSYTPKGGITCKFFINKVNALMTILVKDG